MDNGTSHQPTQKNPSVRTTLFLAWELGYTIAVPIVGFAFLGLYLDKRLGSSPLFLLVCVALAITTTAFWIAKKAKKILRDLQKPPS